MAEAIFVPFGGGATTPEFRTVATRTALAAIAAADRTDGDLVMVLTDNSLWRFNANSAAAADYTGDVVGGAVTSANIVIVPTAGTGRWIRADKAFTMRLAFTQASLNADLLLTVPAGFAVRFTGLPYWDITRVVAGDGARRIAVSSSNMDAEFTAVGDLLGGTAGQLPVIGPTPGTPGDAFTDSDTANTSLATVQKLLIREAETIRYDIVAAGTDERDGMVCIPVSLETAAGTMIS